MNCIQLIMYAFHGSGTSLKGKVFYPSDCRTCLIKFAPKPPCPAHSKKTLDGTLAKSSETFVQLDPTAPKLIDRLLTTTELKVIFVWLVMLTDKEKQRDSFSGN